MTAATKAEQATRLAALRAELQARGLDGFLVPRADEFQGEFVPPSAERLAWLTGFTGSAGLAIVLADTAALFVDGRYTLQAADQTDAALYEQHHLVETPASVWLAGHVGQGAKVGFDPWLHTPAERDRIAGALDRTGAELVACESNPLDAVWPDRPAPPQAEIVIHPVEYSGKPSEEKRAEIAAILREDGLAASVITAPDALAWLLNIRGGDVAHIPLPLGFGVLHDDASVELFVDPAKIGVGLERHFGNRVSIAPPDAFAPALDGLKGRKVRLDRDQAPVWVRDRLLAAGAEVDPGSDPVALPKACKNATELAGARAAHRRDGAAMTRFLHWLEIAAPAGETDELGAAAKLYEFRAADPLFRDNSFETISGAGPNGAIVHYRVTPETNCKLAAGSLYLVDSGGQYLDGTTDITRTVVVGEPDDEMRDRFTRVLQGHIALSTARFPAGTSGSQLDAFARRALWQAGLDYDHGTGHGVGSFLQVHEGPARISKLPNTVALKPGMILSNEPGYYKTGAWGIRTENLIAVRTCEIAGAEREMLDFEVLTLAPIDRRLIAAEMLTDAERTWLDAYHARVEAELMPLLEGEVAAWLHAATRPL